MNNPDHLQDIFFEISNYLPFSSLVAWSLTSRTHYDALTGVILHKLGGCEYRPLKEWRDEVRPQYCPHLHNRRHMLDIHGGDLYFTTFSRAAVLVWAASLGHVRTVRNILSVEEMGPWIDIPVLSSGHGTSLGSLGMTPLHAAADGGHAGVIDLLVEYGADVEATVAGNLRPIHFAKNENVVMALVRHGSSIHPQGKSSVPPLTYILTRNLDLSAVRCLVSLGCDINAPTWLGVTAVDAAIQAGNTEALKLLLDAGPDLSHWTSGVDSLISEVVGYHQRFRPYVALRMMRILTQHYVTHDPKTAESSLRRPAEVGSASDLENAHGPFGMISEEGIMVIKRLLLDTTNAGVSRELPDTDQYLHMANTLLHYGESLDTYRENSRSAKFLSDHSQNYPEFLDWIFMFLLDQLAGNLMLHSYQHPIQQPPIHTLFTRGYRLFKSDANTGNDTSVFERLLDFGADPNERDSEGNTLLALLCQLPADTFENKSCAMHGTVSWVSESRNERFYIWYLDSVSSQDCNLDVRDSNKTVYLGRLPVMPLPCLLRHKKKRNFMWHRAHFLNFLLKKGADVHKRQGPSLDKPLCAGGTPLHFACYDGDPAMVKLLFEHGAEGDVNQLSDSGLTPLMVLETVGRNGLLEKSQFEEIKQLLSDAGAT
ncbi:Ff.00g020690.m01.CDS01 [Fusarium sp. VM40]|nr:Ff.00g020690.m01.CDS01 [Fusarium sp. VM40]